MVIVQRVRRLLCTEHQNSDVMLFSHVLNGPVEYTPHLHTLDLDQVSYKSLSFGFKFLGANIAVTWATLNKVGRNGYVKKTGAVLEAASKLRKGIEKIEHLDIMGDPVGSVIAFCSKTINVFQVSDLFHVLNLYFKI